MDLLAMRMFGRLGRSGNQIFQYLFLRTYAEQHGLEVRLPRWDGTTLFGHAELPPPSGLPTVYERRSADGRRIFPPQRVHRNVNVVGFFQYHTSYYRRSAATIRALFQPTPELRANLERAFAPTGTLVGIHVRRSDYGFRYYYLTPIAWYLDWLRAHWASLAEPTLYVASDDPSIRNEFAAYRPLAPVSVPGVPSWYQDFYALSRCDVVLMPNSTFSFAAALVGKPGARTFRSDPSTRRFEPLDVWDAEPLDRSHSYEAFRDQPELWRPDAEERSRIDPMPGWSQFVERSIASDW